MLVSCVTLDRPLQVLEFPWLWSFREDGAVDVFGRIPSRLPDDDVLPIVLPLEHGARTDAHLSADFGGNGDLTLGRDL
jgi:hypothetical protein